MFSANPLTIFFKLCAIVQIGKCGKAENVCLRLAALLKRVPNSSHQRFPRTPFSGVALVFLQTWIYRRCVFCGPDFPIPGRFCLITGKNCRTAITLNIHLQSKPLIQLTKYNCNCRHDTCVEEYTNENGGKQC